MRCRNTLALLLLLLVAAAGCAPAPVGLGVNVKISPAWGEQIESVLLIFCGGDELACTCSTIDLDGGRLEDWADCSWWDPYGPPSGAFCIDSQERLTTDPGEQGVVRHLPVGNHTVVGYGLDELDNDLSHDCESFTIREGEYTEVSIDL